MSTYLVAFVVSNFVPNKDDAAFKVWARKKAQDQTGFAQNIGPKILEYIGVYNGVAFNEMKSQTGEKMTKMDLAAIPDFAAGAMENWGLLTYR